jgi:hypothetical protein
VVNAIDLNVSVPAGQRASRSFKTEHMDIDECKTIATRLRR